jgi:hypothetical protein
MIRNAFFTIAASTMAVTAFGGTLTLAVLHVSLVQPAAGMHIA